MIRFSDVNGAPKEISAPEKLNNIETTSLMSDLEVDSFWKAEFANARETVEMDPYERLLSESFNRSEEEINIDFNVDEKLLSALESFGAVSEEGYTAKKLAGMSKYLNGEGAFMMLIELRENPEKALAQIQDGFKLK